MQLTFSAERLCFPVSDDLMEILQTAVSNVKNSPTVLTIIFKDSSYSPTTGGFHPVEIRLLKSKDCWLFDYVTDFSFQRLGDMSELTKEIDFNFIDQTTFHLYSGDHKAENTVALFNLWQSNFINYVEMEVFTVEVTEN
mgnify:CR=1 FL=1|jgi:hypothetical protein|tara:strand:- start:2877 stop:3293 length:417 start_codon:yes stop_codon:yes gene_type:complete